MPQSKNTRKKPRKKPAKQTYAKKKKISKPVSTGEEFSLNTDNSKIPIVARNLLRLYQYLQIDKPIEENKLIQELEMDTLSGCTGRMAHP